MSSGEVGPSHQRPPWTVLVCPDKFRGSLTAAQAAAAIAAGLAENNAVHPVALPVADGGEGVVECCLGAGFHALHRMVRRADGRPTPARVAVSGQLAVIESAQACGLAQNMPSAAVAVTASSYGVGELIRAVLDLGIREIVVGVGGTASTDGGAGMLQALGAVLHDTGGEVLRPGGASLNDLATIDLRGLDQRLSNCRLVVATDVDNPLLGGNGAAAVFGPQKGADATAVRVLEHGLDRWSHLLAARLGRNQAGLPGAGAGGGIGFGLLTVGAARVSGAATLLDLLHFDDHAKTADLIVTGEGSMDATRLNGKAPTTLAKRAHALGVPVAAVVGRCTLSAAEQRQTGIDRVYVLLNIAESPEQSMRDAGRLLTKIGQQISASIDDATISDDPSR